MCREIKNIQKVADTFQKHELHELSEKLTKEDKIDLVNSLVTLWVVADHFTKELVA